MLEVDEAVFPNNLVKYIAFAMEGIDEGVKVFKRPLSNSDPRQSIGVFAQTWDPVPDSLEMQGIGHPAPQLPTLQRYRAGVQAFVKDSERERGLNVHSVLAARTRMVLYTDPNLQVIFGELSAELDGWLEKMNRWGISLARYFSGEIEGETLYLSTLELWFETETRPNI